MSTASRITFLACVNDELVATRWLLASPCLAEGTPHQLLLARDMPSAGAGFAWGHERARHEWVVFLHQDVFLPAGWDRDFLCAIDQAEQADPRLAVVGVYGVDAAGAHVGHVMDRDRWLGAPFEGARPVRALDELLVAVRRGSGLHVDTTLNWHLWATDLCLQAEAMGRSAAVVCAPCEHHSSLPREVSALPAATHHRVQKVVDAFNAAAARFATKWPAALPVVTPVARIDRDFHFELPAAAA